MKKYILMGIEMFILYLSLPFYIVAIIFVEIGNTISDSDLKVE